MRILSIISVLFMGCSNSTEPNAGENSCSDGEGTFLYNNSSYSCSDIKVIQDFIDENLSLDSLTIVDFINGYTDMDNFNHISVAWNNGKIVEFTMFFDLVIIPSSISNLNKLEHLNLGDWNEIETFPIALCDLTQIQYLDLSRNKIQMVPDCIGNLGNLQILDLDENMISYIPESICSIANNIYNCYIELDGNNLCEQYHFSCLSDIAWNYNGMSPQNQSNCCEGLNGEANWVQCP